MKPCLPLLMGDPPVAHRAQHLEVVSRVQALCVQPIWVSAKTNAVIKLACPLRNLLTTSRALIVLTVQHNLLLPICQPLPSIFGGDELSLLWSSLQSLTQIH
jgi:hypothetical protein